MTEQFQADLEEASKRELREPRRTHLGASEIGSKCAREVWGKLRWVLDVPWEGRMLRLFDRGKREEAQFWRWFEAMGMEVRPWAERLVYHTGSDSFASIPWDAEITDDVDDVSTDPFLSELAYRQSNGALPKQWGFADHGGHYSGSTDGKVTNVFTWFPQATGWGLLECKTHGEKSFNELKSKAVQVAKPEHYIQMQTYMRYGNLGWALYAAVNKNTDEIYVEIVEQRPEVGDAYSDRAGQLLEARIPPPRISPDPSFFGCRFCDLKRQCHYGEAVEKNCRSCQFASPGPDKTWVCGLHNQTIPATFIPKGCDRWVGVEFGGK